MYPTLFGLTLQEYGGPPDETEKWRLQKSTWNPEDILTHLAL
jgi:hypothetical protein